MNKITGAIAVALLTSTFASGTVLAQGAPQVVAKVDLQNIQTAYRATKIVGSTVYDDKNETIGKIDDLLISQDGKAPYAVLSVGGWLGMGERMIVVNTSSLRVVYDKNKSDDTKIVLPGATKESLKGPPQYNYSKK